MPTQPTQTAPYSASNAEDYLRTRVDFKTEAYRRKGERYRWSYLVMAAIAAASAAAVPALINLPNVDKIYPTVLSLVVTILVSFEGLFHMREHWKNYDLMKTFLRQEACLFQAGAGVYRGMERPEAFILLVERVEEEISKERAQTIQMRTARSSDPAPAKVPPRNGPR
jgi:hypothetical protein